MFKDIASANVLADKPENAVYTIDGKPLLFVNGKYEGEITADFATKAKASIFGEPVYGDLNEDGKDDAVLLIEYDPGGSGTFYYVASAVNVDGKYKGSNAVLLGDRIAPQNVLIENGEVVANYAERKSDEPMVAIPSVGVSKYLKYESGVLKEITK
jgi:hypothetical protein